MAGGRRGVRKSSLDEDFWLDLEGGSDLSEIVLDCEENGAKRREQEGGSEDAVDDLWERWKSGAIRDLRDVDARVLLEVPMRMACRGEDEATKLRGATILLNLMARAAKDPQFAQIVGLPSGVEGKPSLSDSARAAIEGIESEAEEG